MDVKPDLLNRGWSYIGRCGCGGWSQEKYKKGVYYLKVGIRDDKFVLSGKGKYIRGVKSKLINTIENEIRS